MLKSIRRIRKMTYVVWAWCILIVVWAVAGASSASTPHCARAYQHACVEGAQAGTGIGVAIVLLIGFFGFVFFSLIWFMTRPKERVA